MNNTMTKTALPGYYRHYKGQFYQLLAVVRHSEEDEPYALYRALYGDFGLWVRPLAMFCETVSINDEPVQRFAYYGQQAPAQLTLPPELTSQPYWGGTFQE